MLQELSLGTFEPRQSSSAEPFPTEEASNVMDFVFDEDILNLEPEAEQGKKAKSKFTIIEGSLTAHFTAETGEQVLYTEDLGLEESLGARKSKFEVNRTETDPMFEEDMRGFDIPGAAADDVFAPSSSRMLSSPDSRSTSSSSSPVLTLASSFKDSSSISRGFVVPPKK